MLKLIKEFAQKAADAGYEGELNLALSKSSYQKLEADLIRKSKYLVSRAEREGRFIRLHLTAVRVTIFEQA